MLPGRYKCGFKNTNDTVPESYYSLPARHIYRRTIIILSGKLSGMENVWVAQSVEDLSCLEHVW